MRGAPTHHCPACGYALTGLAFPCPCPECGIDLAEGDAHVVKPWPSNRRIALAILWPALCTPLLPFLWLIHFWPGVLSSTAVLLAAMFIPIWTGGEIALHCALPNRRETVFLQLLLFGWLVNLAAWSTLTFVGYQLHT